MDVGRDHLIHREAVPLPRKDRVESEEWRVEIMALDMRRLAPIAPVYFWGYSSNSWARICLPLEGKGDRSAVDEVNMRPAPLRGA